MKILILSAAHAYSFTVQSKALEKGFRRLGIEAIAVPTASRSETERIVRSERPTHVLGVGNYIDFDLVVESARRLGCTAIPWVVADDYDISVFASPELLTRYAAEPMILTPSEHCKRNLLRKSSIRADKIVVIPEAVDDDAWRPLPSDEVESFKGDLSIPIDTGDAFNKFDLSGSHAPIILTTGGDVTKKGAQEVIRALAKLPRSIPWIYMMKTWPGPYTFARSIEELTLAEELGVIDRIRYVTGEFADHFMSKLMNVCDVYAAPSRGEGFGLPLVEAMMTGKPVVSMRATSTQETVVDGRTGFLAKVDPAAPEGSPKADIDDLARCFELILTDSELRAKLGADAREHARASFAPQVVAQRFLDHMRDM